MPFGALTAEWNHFADSLSLSVDLLPVVSNPSATISPKSVLKSLGKTPSRYNSQHCVVGIPEWAQHQATMTDVLTWQREPDYGICLQTRRVRAIDVDIDDADSVGLVRSVLAQHHLPERFRSDSSRILLLVDVTDCAPRRPIVTSHGKIECLTTGRQCVVAGQHPKGARYQWRDGLPATIPTLTTQEFDELWETLKLFSVEPDEQEREVKERSAQLIDAKDNDPVAQHLNTEGWVEAVGRHGELHIRCPFEDGHTTGAAGDTSTTYFLAHTHGYAQGHFVCKHASCFGRSDTDFERGVGYDPWTFGPVSDEAVALPADVDTASARYTVQTIPEFLAAPGVQWLVKGLIPAMGLCIIYGQPSSGKTFLTLDLVGAVSRGEPWRGFKTPKNVGVAYLCAEGTGGFRTRVRAYLTANSLDDLPMGVLADAPSFLDPADTLAVGQAVRAARIPNLGLLVVDTLASVLPGDENASEDMGKVIRACKNLSRMLSVAVVLVHHMDKKGTYARGHGSLKAAADLEISVTEDQKNGSRALKIEKNKDGVSGVIHPFNLRVVDLGVDQDGDPVTSCVVDFNAADANQAFDDL